MNERKNTLRENIKAASQEEILQKWTEHFKNLLENSPEITDKIITKIINRQLDNKLGEFTEKELDSIKKKKKN